ncbi:MAG TPA: hypothetical protein VGH89_05335 [Pseudonocardia sp.]|jgi:hypothetical protein
MITTSTIAPHKPRCPRTFGVARAGRYQGRIGRVGVLRKSALRAPTDARYRAVFALFTSGAGRLQPDMQPKDYMLRCWERVATFPHLATTASTASEMLVRQGRFKR